MAAVRKALIVGLGLIGGSIGMALRTRGWHVGYVDPHVELDEARRAAAADERLAAIGPDWDVVVLATPVDVALRILPTLDLPCVVTSVCSVMLPLRANARGRFVAGHPMAGSEKRTLDAADGALFAGKRWFVDAAEPIVEELVRDCSARIEPVEADEHDRAVALTSHLPQLLSTALAATFAAAGDDLLRFAGTGLETFLRLAGSDAAVWMPIMQANRAEIASQLARVEQTAQAILSGDEQPFADARYALEALRTLRNNDTT